MTSSGWIAPRRRCWGSGRGGWGRSRSGWGSRCGLRVRSWPGCRSWRSGGCPRRAGGGGWTRGRPGRWVGGGRAGSRAGGGGVRWACRWRDGRAGDRAQAAPGPDEEVARELEGSACRAQARGGLAAAAAFLERAAVLTPEPARRAQRLLAAASAKRDAGALDAALELLVAVEAGPRDALQAAEVEHLRGQIAQHQRRGTDAARLLLSAARRLEPLDPALARETHLEALVAALWAADLDNPGGVLQAARAARAAPPGPQPPRVVDVLLDAFAVRFTEGDAAAAPALARALKLLVAVDVGDDEVGRWFVLETVVNAPGDLRCQRRLRNLDELQAKARDVNARLLDTERVGQGCVLASPAFERVALPAVTTDGRRAPALRFGDPRVMALLGALCAGLSALGFTHRSLRARVSHLLSSAYTANQMSYDLARLRLNGLIERLEHTNTYVPTPEGQRVAVFYTKLHDRLLRPLLAANAPPAPPELRRALATIDRHIRGYINDARLGNAA